MPAAGGDHRGLAAPVRPSEDGGVGAEEAEEAAAAPGTGRRRHGEGGSQSRSRAGPRESNSRASSSFSSPSVSAAPPPPVIAPRRAREPAQAGPHRRGAREEARARSGTPRPPPGERPRASGRFAARRPPPCTAGRGGPVRWRGETWIGPVRFVTCSPPSSRAAAPASAPFVCWAPRARGGARPCRGTGAAARPARRPGGREGSSAGPGPARRCPAPAVTGGVQASLSSPPVAAAGPAGLPCSYPGPLPQCTPRLLVLLWGTAELGWFSFTPPWNPPSAEAGVSPSPAGRVSRGGDLGSRCRDLCGGGAPGCCEVRVRRELPKVRAREAPFYDRQRLRTWLQQKHYQIRKVYSLLLFLLSFCHDATSLRKQLVHANPFAYEKSLCKTTGFWEMQRMMLLWCEGTLATSFCPLYFCLPMFSKSSWFGKQCFFFLWSRALHYSSCS